MASKYTIENAHRALPHLVHYAKMRKTITYKELSEKIDRHWRAAQFFLRYIRDEICVKRDLPLITVIVINQETGMPGESWLPEGTQHLTVDEYRQKFEEYRDKVYAYEAWDSLLQELSLLPVPITEDDLDDEGLAHTTVLERKGHVGEGESHKRLKKYVAQNPTAIGIQAERSAKQEYLFVSGDRCDVVFDLGQDGYAVVEIKNGERGELVKGLYQAVKYRALMVAEKGHGQDYPVNAYLVAYDIPDDIAQFAKKFGIQCHSIPRSALNV